MNDQRAEDFWCGGDSDRGQCVPCAALLDAVHAALAAGFAAIIEAARPPRDDPSTLDLYVRLTAEEATALKDAHEHVRVHMAHHHPWAVRDAAMIGLGKVLKAVRAAKEGH